MLRKDFVASRSSDNRFIDTLQQGNNEVQPVSESSGAGNSQFRHRQTTQNPPEKVPILAIGASAGGLEPYEVFFDAMPVQSGMAVVVIQHLSRSFKSMMDELLARHTSMGIKRVEDGMTVVPNTIFLNPPHSEMTIEHGCFRISDTVDGECLHLPINTFFKSISEEYGADAMAIVLSGTGSDGTEGAEAIRKSGGTVLVQDPSSAKFDGMPTSVIRSGLADVVALPGQLPDCVMKIRDGVSPDKLPAGDGDQEPVERIFQLLRNRFGTEFGYYKEATILRRLQRRANIKSMCIEDYADVVSNNTDELESLYADLLIEVTSFFRDADAFTVVEENIIPDICKNMSETRTIRIWVPGCASGEEAYSLAILMAEYARKNDIKLNFKILATDIHHRSLNFASSGIYAEESLAGLTQAQIERYFDRDGAHHQIKSNLRRMVLFSPHNILKDPPFTRIDFVSCRNVLIYFNEAAQQKSLALFHFSLLKDGYLFLGPSETTGKLVDEFSLIDQRWRIFRKTRDVKLLASTAPLRIESELPRQVGPSGRESVAHDENSGSAYTARNAQTLAIKEMLRLYAPAGFLLTRTGEIAQVFGDAGDLLKIDSGVFSSNIVDLVIDELKLVVTAGLERTKSTGKVKFERRINLHDDTGPFSLLVRFEPIVESGDVSSYRLLTLEKSRSASVPDSIPDGVKSLDYSEAAEILNQRIHELERDLGTTEESLQSTIEELETSNEELQATNEELMASNEELQSTNEELHSVNEELYTVSSEHQRKIEELTELTDDMNHLLKATEIGIIFLDKDLKIRRFTPSATSTFNLIAEDVGRPIDHVTHKFLHDNLRETIDTVIETNTIIEMEISVDSIDYMLRVLPYTASLDEETGVVITTIDISELKAAQIAEKKTAYQYGQIVSDLSEYVLRWRADDGTITYCNRRYADSLNNTIEELTGRRVEGVVADRNAFKDTMDKLECAGESAKYFIERAGPDGKELIISGIVRALGDGDDKGTIVEYQATGIDVTESYRYQRAVESLLHVDDGLVDTEHNPISEVLNIGAEYFRLPCALIGQISDNELRVQHAVSDSLVEEVLQAGDTISVDQCVFVPVVDEDVLLTSNIERESRRSMKFHRGSSLVEDISVAALVSVRLVTCNGPFGTLSFYGSHSLAGSFSEEQRMFAKLLSKTVGYQLERNQQIDNVMRRRQHYQQLYYQTPVMMCTVNKSANLLEANEEFLTQLGHERHNVIGRSLEDFVSRDQESNTSLDDIANRLTHEVLRKKPVDLTTAHGSVVRTEMSAMKRTEFGSEEVRYLLVLEDVTQRDLAMSEARHQKEELLASNEGLSQFAYIASHDLQEPLRKIRQFGDLLEQEYNETLTGDGLYYVDVITNASARISSLVSDLLDYSRTSNAEFALTPLDLKQVFKDVLADLDAHITDTGASVTSNELPVVIADKGAIGHLFRNLISNGLKYRKTNVAPEIKITSDRKDNRIDIHFMDNGIGMEGSADPKIFEPFVRLEKRTEYSGTGIGLAICKSVCDRLDWKISYTSKVGSGTTFSISIPEKSLFHTSTVFGSNSE